MTRRHRVRITAHTAKAIAEALGGAPCGDGWRACCPAHDDHTPSLSIHEVNGKPLIHCFAGCSQDQVLAALRARGMWPGRRGVSDRSRPRLFDGDPSSTKQAYALSLWNRALDARSTLVETYLQARGITFPPPPVLRFLPSIKHNTTGLWRPAMIASVVDINGKLMGIHRTYLTRDGGGKADVPVGQQKMALGPCRGGAVRLAEPTDGTLILAEGIETALSIMQFRGTAAWATLGTPGMQSVVLPPEIRDVIIAADADARGEAAAQCAALRWAREGRRVRIARPPAGLDFNDLLMKRGSAS